MGGLDGTEKELTDKAIIDKLKRILKCLDSDGGQMSQKIDEGDEWFKTRKEKLRVPPDGRKEEMKAMLAEKTKKMEKEQNKSPETVLNTIYPNMDKDAGDKDEKLVKDCKKPDIPEVKSNEYPSQTDMKVFQEFGLLQGPYQAPFLVEMSMGHIMVGCQCIKRNGLQGDCQKKLCKGKKTCLQLPLPMCVPSGYGKIKPKETKIFIGDTPSCPKEEILVQEKTVKTQKKCMPVRKDYIDSPPVVPRTKCSVHVKGKYYIRPTRRNKNVQTEDLIDDIQSPSIIYPVCPSVEIIAN